MIWTWTLQFVNLESLNYFAYLKFAVSLTVVAKTPMVSITSEANCTHKLQWLFWLVGSMVENVYITKFCQAGS